MVGFSAVLQELTIPPIGLSELQNSALNHRMQAWVELSPDDDYFSGVIIAHLSNFVAGCWSADRYGVRDAGSVCLTGRVRTGWPSAVFERWASRGLNRWTTRRMGRSSCTTPKQQEVFYFRGRKLVPSSGPLANYNDFRFLLRRTHLSNKAHV